MSVDFIKHQLEIVKGLMGYRYGDGSLDAVATGYIAALISDMGFNDIRDISVQTFTDTVQCTTHNFRFGDVTRGYQTSSYAFINKRTGALVTEKVDEILINEFCNAVQANGVRSGDAYRFAYGFRPQFYGDLIVRVWVKFSGDIPLFFVDLFDPSGMKFGEALKQLATIVLAVASFVVPGVNAAIASSIFGSLATAYPVLTAALSNVMINTALNGGDVESAVKNAAAAYLGQSAGSLVNGVADSQAAGQLAAAAVTAAARGGDVEQAVAAAALRLAPGVVVDMFTEPVQPLSPSASYFDPVYDAPSITPAVEPNMSVFDIPNLAPVLDDVNYSEFDFSVGGDFSGFDLPVMPLDMSGDPMFDSSALYTANLDSQYVPVTAGVLSPLEYDQSSTFSGDSGISAITDTFIPSMAPTMTPAVQPLSTNDAWGGETEGSSGNSDSSFFGNISFSDVVSGISNTAIALLRVNQAYRAAGSPSIQPATRSTVSGANQTVRAYGTIVTTDPNTGYTNVTRAPVGVPYVLPNGSIVTNNGDGSYTTINSSGARTSQYAPITTSAGSVGSVLTGSTMVAGVPNWAIFSGGAVAIALLLKR